jgi:hypothetical protein
MEKLAIGALEMTPPTNFVPEETMMTFRAPDPTELKEPLVLAKQTPSRPNLIVHWRSAGDSPSLEKLAAEVIVELSQSVVGMTEQRSGEFVFADGYVGFIASFEFHAGQNVHLKQWVALRLVGDHVAAFTLTMGVETPQDVEQKYLEAIASAVVSGEGA